MFFLLLPHQVRCGCRACRVRLIITALAPLRCIRAAPNERYLPTSAGRAHGAGPAPLAKRPHVGYPIKHAPAPEEASEPLRLSWGREILPRHREGTQKLLQALEREGLGLVVLHGLRRHHWQRVVVVDGLHLGEVGGEKGRACEGKAGLRVKAQWGPQVPKNTQGTTVRLA